MAAQFTDSVFEICGPQLPKLILPYPVSSSTDQIVGRVQQDWVYDLLSAPPYELAISQAATTFALNCADAGVASGALAIARTFRKSLFIVTTEVELDTQSAELVRSLLPPPGDVLPALASRKRWRPSELLSMVDCAFALPYPTSRETKLAEKGVQETLGRCLRHWLMNMGIPKGAAISYLLTLESAMQLKTSLPLPPLRRFNDQPDLDCDPRLVIRNLSHQWEETGEPRPDEVNIRDFCKGFEDFFESKLDFRG